MPYINVLGKSAFYQENRPGRELTGSGEQEKGIPLLLVHGAGGSSSKWEDQLAGLNGYRVIAPDLPGHGRSAGEAAGSIASYREFCRDLALNLGLKKFVLAGHSMGGAIALDFALSYPELLSGLIIVDSGSKLKVNPEILKILALGEHPLDSIKFQYAADVSQAVLDRAAAEMKTVPPEVFLADFRACDSFNLMDQVKYIQLPALILCGQEDQMTPVKYSDYLHKDMPNSTLALIPHAGHMAMVEQPELVNQAIRDLLSSI